MEKKICSECGTENESEYAYCKNCGAPLIKPAEKNETEFIGENIQSNSQASASAEGGSVPPTGFTPPIYSAPNYGGQQYSPYSVYADYSIDGVPAEDIAFFIGKKSTEIMPKFIKMEITRSKTSWCWPAAVLGFFFGPLGAALWFFYRKMYKIALILLAVGTVITFSTAALTYNTDSTVIDSLIGSLNDGDLNSFMDALGNIDGRQTVLDVIASGIENLASLATCILAGLFGYHAYKEHCVKTIRSFRQNGIDPRYYRIGLASLGGVSGGMLAVGILAMFVIQGVASELTLVLSYL